MMVSRRKMMINKFSLILCLLVSILFHLAVSAARGQAAPGQEPQVPEITVPRRPSIPPDFGDREPAQQKLKMPKFNSARAQRDAQQLAALAQKIPVQIDQVSKNSLPKDLIPNLKEIEKLAKHLRAEIPE